MKKGFLIFLGGLFPVLSLLGAEGFHWEQVSPYPNLGTISGVAYGEGKFIAAGSDTLGISEDGGRTWERLRNLPLQNYTAVIYTNDQFVAVGTWSLVYSNGNWVPASPGGDVVRSGDGRSWTSTAVTNWPGLLTLNYWKGMYVATGRDGVIGTSVDATNWNFITNVSNRHLTMAVGGEERFLGVSFGPTHMVISTNGVDWTTHFPDNLTGGLVLGMSYLNGKFLLDVIMPGQFWSSHFHTLVSTNAIDWVDAREPYVIPYYFGERFWVEEHTLLTVNGNVIEKGPLWPTGGTEQQPEYTTNLVDWIGFSLSGQRDEEINPFVLAGAYGDGRYVLAGKDFLATGPDLLLLERVDSPVKTLAFNSVAAAGERLVAVSGPNPAVSTNGGQSFEIVLAPKGVGI